MPAGGQNLGVKECYWINCLLDNGNGNYIFQAQYNNEK